MDLTISQAFSELLLSHELFKKFLKIEEIKLWVKKNWIANQKIGRNYYINDTDLKKFINEFIDIKPETFKLYKIEYDTFQNLEESRKWGLHTALFGFLKEKEDSNRKEQLLLEQEAKWANYEVEWHEQKTKWAEEEKERELEKRLEEAEAAEEKRSNRYNRNDDINEEEQIMRALKNGNGDLFGF